MLFSLLDRRLPCLGTVLLLASVLPGCMEAAEPDASIDSSGTKPTRSASPYTGSNPDLGALEGIVYDNTTWHTLSRARVLLGGVRELNTTDGGDFAFRDLEPGTYALRVGAHGYESQEFSIEVLAGRITVQEVFLNQTLPPGSQPHDHNYWPPEGHKVLLDRSDLYWPWSVARGTENQGTLRCAKMGSGIVDIPSAESPYLPGPSHPCNVMEIVLPTEEPNNFVLPGTTEMRVTLDWTPHPLVPKIQFTYLPANGTNGKTVSLTTPGTVVKIPVRPEMADPGHQSYTLWRFMLHVPSQSSVVGDTLVADAHSGDFINQFVAPFRVKIEIFRDDVPLEPAHPNYWTTGDRLELLHRAPLVIGKLKIQSQLPPDHVAYPGPFYPRDPTGQDRTTSFALPDGVIVPWGTTRLEVRLEYVWNSSAALGKQSGTDKALAFRTPATYPPKATVADLRVEEPDSTKTGNVTWSLAVSPEESDPIYSKKSSWQFLLANAGRERDDTFINECSGACGGTTYWLTVVALNENWEEEIWGKT